VEKFQMTGVVLGKKKIQKPVIVFEDTRLTLSTNTNRHWLSKFPSAIQEVPLHELEVVF
jgi:hypothetical protein